MEKLRLLVNGTVIAIDKKFSLYQQGAVAVRGDSIVAVGDSAELRSQYEATELIDCTDQLIIPGFVNAHTHVPMTLLRGLNDDLRLDGCRIFDPGRTRICFGRFCATWHSSGVCRNAPIGITTFADMYYYESDIAARTTKIGMRALLGQTIMVFPHRCPHLRRRNRPLSQIHRRVARASINSTGSLAPCVVHCYSPIVASVCRVGSGL